jgi:hypothetical protein
VASQVACRPCGDVEAYDFHLADVDACKHEHVVGHTLY